MRFALRAPEGLFAKARADLARPHPFAFERLGWIAIKPAMAGDTMLLLGTDYHPIADSHYVNDPTMGARIGADAMTAAIGVALRDKVGMFHIHHHWGRGTPSFSRTDVEEQPNLVMNFLTVRRGIPHGALLFSDDGIAGKVWLGPSDVWTIDEVYSVGLRSRAFYPRLGGWW